MLLWSGLVVRLVPLVPATAADKIKTWRGRAVRLTGPLANVAGAHAPGPRHAQTTL